MRKELMSKDKFKYSFNARICNIQVLSLLTRLFVGKSDILIKNQVQSNDFYFYFVMLCHLCQLYL